MTGMAALTPITGSPATRFALDQAAARAFLALARRRWHGLPGPAAPPSEDWAADPRWNPRELPDDELSHLEALIAAAQEAGAITGPADWDIRLLITTDCDGVSVSVAGSRAARHEVHPHVRHRREPAAHRRARNQGQPGRAEHPA